MTDYVTQVCTQCGSLRSVCSEPAALYPQRTVCYVTATALAVDRRTRDHHGEPDRKSVHPHYTDGMSVWMSNHDLTPDDDFGGALSVTPSAGGAEQSLGDEE